MRDEFKPEVGSWWMDKNSEFEVLMVGEQSAFCRRPGGTEYLTVLARWRSRFTPFSSMPEPTVRYVIQRSSGHLGYPHEGMPLWFPLNPGERIFRVTTTYELVEEKL